MPENLCNEGGVVLTYNIIKCTNRNVHNGCNERAEGNHHCYVKFEGVMVDIICKIDKKYEKCVKKSKYTNKKFLYGKLNRALYGTILGAKLFYDKLSSELVKLEFK